MNAAYDEYVSILPRLATGIEVKRLRPSVTQVSILPRLATGINDNH